MMVENQRTNRNKEGKQMCTKDKEMERNKINPKECDIPEERSGKRRREIHVRIFCV